MAQESMQVGRLSPRLVELLVGAVVAAFGVFLVAKSDR